MTQPVPLLDLQAHYNPIEDAVLGAIQELFKSKQFILGKPVEDLEKAICHYCDCTYSVGVSSGTDAILMALMALKINPGDEIITSPFTFFATAGCISRIGAKPVFVDIDPCTYTIDPLQIEAAITARTKAIMPVHLFGQMADMDPIMAIAKRHNLAVIEDASQAIGSTYTSREGKTYKAGTMGTAGCFSYFPSKNLGCCGDGGHIVCNDPALAEHLFLIRNHGAKERYFHDVVGGNFRLDAIQAAILLVKLPYLEQQHHLRQTNAAYYDQHLEKSIQKPIVKPYGRMIYNQYTLRVQNRASLQATLTEHHIGHAIYYPLPLHLQACFAYLGYREGDFPHTEKATQEVLSIPIYAELTVPQKESVVSVINQWHKNQ